MGARPRWDHDIPMLRPLASDPPPGRLADRTVRCNPAAIGVLLQPHVFAVEECAGILEKLGTPPSQRGAMVGGYDATRQCRTVSLPAIPGNAWIYDRVAEAFLEANRQFDFEIAGMIEPLLAASYGEGDYFDWHLDAGPGLSAYRKISMSVLLTRPHTYEGGDLEVSAAAAAYRGLEAGSAIVFPSFLSHRVTRITRGGRISLVAFAHGPTFR